MAIPHSQILLALTTLVAAYGCSATKAAAPVDAKPIAAPPIAKPAVTTSTFDDGAPPIHFAHTESNASFAGSD